mgnify:CR=1 FL=1
MIVALPGRIESQSRIFSWPSGSGPATSLALGHALLVLTSGGRSALHMPGTVPPNTRAFSGAPLPHGSRLDSCPTRAAPQTT